MRAAAALAAVAPALAACDGDVAYIGRQDDAVASCAPACDAGACGVDYCAAIPRLTSPPRIDGALECGLSLASIDAASWRGPDAKPADLSAEYAVAWSDAGLYVFVHVREAHRLPSPAAAGGNVYCGDATHVFVDDDGVFAAPPAYDERSTRQLVAEAPRDDVTAVAIGTVYGPSPTSAGVGAWNAARFRTFPRPDGYVLEAIVTADDLGLPTWKLTAGAAIGFDVSISYGGSPSEYPGDPTCLKRGDFVLRAVAPTGTTSGLPHDDVDAFCRPRLSP